MEVVENGQYSHHPRPFSCAVAHGNGCKRVKTVVRDENGQVWWQVVGKASYTWKWVRTVKTTPFGHFRVL
jgi:hypothetical protein